jgi:hypothetical protein
VNLKSFYTERRKLRISFWGRLTDFMLRLDRGLLMRLKTVLKDGRKAIEEGFSGVYATSSGGFRPRRMCLSL